MMAETICYAVNWLQLTTLWSLILLTNYNVSFLTATISEWSVCRCVIILTSCIRQMSLSNKLTFSLFGPDCIKTTHLSFAPFVLQIFIYFYLCCLNIFIHYRLL